MNVIKNRLNLERVIEHPQHDRFVVTGESLVTNVKSDDSNVVEAVQFEGGPVYYVGQKLVELGAEWEVLSIDPTVTNPFSAHGISSVAVQVKLLKLLDWV